MISIKAYPSLDKVASSGIWLPEADELQTGRHAVCITGYDDKIGGGSFEAINSWGTSWGSKGFFWLSYKQAMQYGNYVVEMMDFETGKAELSGNIEFVKLNDAGTDIPLAVARKKINTNNIIVQGNEKADYSLYKLAESLKSGDMFKMKFSTNSKSYIYVFAEDEKSKISRLFPPKPSISAAINSTNATYYFPSDSTHARLDATAGKENFCILYSKSEIDFEGLMNYIKETRVSVFQGVKDKLATRLLDIKKVKFIDDRMSFQAPAEERSVVCFFVEMKHN